MKLAKIVAGFIAAVMLMLSVMSGAGFSDFIITDGEIDPETGLIFTLLDDDTYMAGCPETGWEPEKDDLIVPGEYKNKKVTRLSGDIFFDIYNNLKSITIPDSILEITDCSSFPYGTALLENISVHENNPNYCSVDGVLYNKEASKLIKYPSGKNDTSFTVPHGVEEIGDYAFINANFEEIDISGSVTSIGRGAFDNCDSLKEINIPNSVAAIENSFCDCKSLKTVIIPASVVSIDVGAFRGSLLNSIVVDDNNSNYTVINDALYTKDGKTLVVYPNGKSDAGSVYTVFDGTEVISYSAFGNNASFESIVIPNTVVNIGSYAFMDSHLKLISIPEGVKSLSGTFYGCNYLETVELPRTLTSIGMQTFGNFPNRYSAITIKYAGSKNDWENVKKATRDNEMLNGAAIFFGDGTTDTVVIDSKNETGKPIQEGNSVVNTDDNSIDFTPQVICNSTLGSIIEEAETIKEIRVSAKENTFSGNVKLCADPSTKSVSAKNDFSVDIRFEDDNGVEVQPKAAVTVKIPVPERLKDKDPIFVYHIGDDGKIEKVEAATEIIDGVRCVVFETDFFSVYVLTGEMVETDGGDVDDTNTTTEELLELLSFSLQIDGTYLATCSVENKDKLVGDIVFPSKYNDIPITTVDLTELGGCNNITSVTIPEGVRHFVIDCCENLKTVNLPSTIEYISSDTIWGCPSLIEVNVSEDNLKYCSEDGIVFSKDKTALILFPAGKNKDVYEIPENVTEIKSRAFAFNQNVRVISVPAGVTKISDDLADYSEKLEAIMVDVDNGAFCSVDGVLFSKDMTRLLEYPPAKADKDYTVPDGILQIHEISNNNLTALVVPDGVSDIGDIECTNLAKVTLPKSLEKYPCIYASVKNAEIVYGGTTAEWNALVKNASEYMKKRYADFIIRCSDSNPGGDTSDPDTSEPDTSDPNTSDPDDGNTSKPDTSEPGTGDTSGDNSGDTSVPTLPVIPSVPDTNGGFSANSNISAGAPGVHISNSLSELIDALMSTEEKEQYKNGANVNVILEVKDISGQVPSNDVRAVEAALGDLSGYRVGKYLDLTLLKTIGKTEKTVIRSRNPITIVIDIPQDLFGYGREYAVIRVHSGEVSVLNDKDSNDETVTIDTDSFSTYVLIYKEQLSPAESDSSNGDTFSGGGLIGDNTSSVGDTTTSLPTNEEDEKIPYTGIQSYTMVYLTAGLIALLVFLLLCFFTGKNGMTEEEKNKAFSKLIAWGKSGGRVRSVIALAAIFFVLTFYYGIGMKTSER